MIVVVFRHYHRSRNLRVCIFSFEDTYCQVTQVYLIGDKGLGIITWSVVGLSRFLFYNIESSYCLKGTVSPAGFILALVPDGGRINLVFCHWRRKMASKL